jgi:hypothetical protein
MEDVPQKILNINHIALEESPRKVTSPINGEILESDVEQ